MKTPKIPLTVPSHLLALLATGQIIRVGTRLIDSEGEVVGFLKETGEFALNIVGEFGAEIGAIIPIPGAAIVGAGVEKVAKVIDEIAEDAQLDRIEESLKITEIMSTIAATASVATLGVSVCGFAAVNRRLKRIDAKLDSFARQLQSLASTLDRLNLKWDVMSSAAISRASEMLDLSLKAENEARRADLLSRAVNDFSKGKHYYLKLVEDYDFWLDPTLPMDAAYELFSRAAVCSLGQIQAEFLLGDYEVSKQTCDDLTKEMRHLGAFEKQQVYQARTDRNQGRVGIDFEHLAKQVGQTRHRVDETISRMELFSMETDVVRKRGITPWEHVREHASSGDGLTIVSLIDQ